MERQVSYSVANFAAKFCNELGTDKTSICSPLSAEIVLALLALGCKNQTHEELLKALNVTDDKAIRSSYKYIMTKLKDVKNTTVNIANKVYLKKDGELKPGIEKVAKKVFQARLDQLDFNDKEAAARGVNNWVAQKTNNKITNIVSPDMMTEDTRMLLVSAIYFQGFWVNKFTVAASGNWHFHVNETTKIHVPMISSLSSPEEPFNYGISQELKAKLLQLKYKGSDASMVIVLPDEVEGLKSVLEKLVSGHNIMVDLETMKSTELAVVIPKFRVETTIDLKTLLPKLGIKSIFDDKHADIDMMTSNEKLFVSDAIQKALIIVDENGTVAAACTMSNLQVLRCARKINRFVANHPFLYLLTVRGILLFIGIYEGSEYAEVPSERNNLTESDIVCLNRLSDFLKRNKPKQDEHDTPRHD